MTKVTLDMKQIAIDTTFRLHIKIKGLRQWTAKVWIVKQLAKVMHLILGSNVDLDVDYVYDAPK